MSQSRSFLGLHCTIITLYLGTLLYCLLVQVPILKGSRNGSFCQLTFLIHTLPELSGSNMRVTGRRQVTQVTQVTHITSNRTARDCLEGYNRSQTLQALIFYVDGLTNTWQFASFKCSCSGLGDGTTLLLGPDIASHHVWSQTFRRQLVFLSSMIWMSTKNNHEELQTVEDEIIMVFRNVLNLIPGDTASHPRRTETTLQFVQNHCFFIMFRINLIDPNWVGLCVV
jgi:hypothetical protein